MATTVDTLLVRIEADMGDLKRDLAKLQNNIDKSSAGIGAAFGRMGSLFKVGVAAVVVTQAARAGLALTQLASDVEEMQAKSSVVFGAFVDDVRQELDAFGDQVGRSRFELEGMAASIQDTFVPMGFARGEAAKLSVQLTKLAVDTASFNNAADTDVMAAFQSALVGNHETVRQFGIIITQAELDLELMRMGIEKGTKSATEAEKVQARLNLIMAGTSDAHGDAARTSESFANKSRALKSELTELGVRIGNELMPFMKDLVDLAIAGTKAMGDFLEAIGLIDAAPLTLKTAEAELAALNAQLSKVKETAKDDSFQKAIEFLEKGGKSGGAGTQKGFADTLKKVEPLINGIAELEAQILALETQQALANAAQQEAAEVTSENSEENKEYKKTIDDLLQSRKLLTLEERGFTKAQIKAIVSAGLLNEALEQESNILSQKLTPELYQTLVIVNGLERRQTALKEAKDAAARASKEYAAALKNLKDIISDTNNPVSTLDAQILALEDHLGSAGPKLAGAAQALEQLKIQAAQLEPFNAMLINTFDQLSGAVADDLVNALADGGDAMEALEDTFNNALKQMAAQIIQMAVLAPMMNAVMSAFGLGTPFSSMRVIGGSAGGGAAYGGQPMLVGERGPEIFVPHSAGRIMNNASSQRAMSGGDVVVNQTINVETGVSQTVRAEMLSLLPVIKQDTMNAVADQNRRGGSFRQALA